MFAYEPKNDFASNYKYLIGGILPRPIAFVSTRNVDGSNNVAPFSFFTAISASPMIVAFCPMIRSSDGKKKDTVINIEREREFVINMVTQNMIDPVNTASMEVPYGEDEFLLSQLTPIDSLKVKAKRVKESPLHFECVLRDVLNYGDTPGSGRIITGEVVQVHADEKIMQNGRIITQLFQPVGRGAGNDWILCDHVIEKERLMKMQIQK